VVDGCRGLQGFPKPRWLKDFQFGRSPGIAEYCVWVRVKLGSSFLDSYSHCMPSMSRNTADGMDEALG
jgi:hypothetical protein